MSIRLRLTLLYTALMALALGMFSLVLYGTLRWTLIQTVDESLADVAMKVANNYLITGRMPDMRGMAERSIFVQIRTKDRVAAQSLGLTGRFPLPRAAENGHHVYVTETDAEGTSYRLYTMPVSRFGSTEPLFYVQVAQPLTLMDAVNDRLRLPLAVGTFLFVGLAGFGSWLLARRALMPVQQVAQAARAVGSSADLSLRVPYSGQEDEVGQLARTFNEMLDQLEGVYGRLAAAVDAQQRFVADASHELRTPLTIIRGNIDYLRKAGTLDGEALADMASEAERMTRLVEQLLTTARADAGQAPELSPEPLGPLVREVCRKAQALPREVEFITDLPEALDRVVVPVHSEWLTRALLILIDNAFKYTPAGRVTVRAGRQGDGVVIQVQDTGIGIAPEDLAHIFERFYRADRARARGGAGLGLAIARWVAGAHDGRLTVESNLGEGSTFSLWLPLHRDNS